MRHIQIILRLYKSKSEILTHFDVDCCCFGYDGNKVYGSPRAVTALLTQSNTVDLTRRSPSYEYRLAKYALRGFEIYWDKLDRDRIDESIFKAGNLMQGLARLLVLEKKANSRGGKEVVLEDRPDRSDLIADPYVGSLSDYSTFKIPYGMDIDANATAETIKRWDLMLNSGT